MNKISNVTDITSHDMGFQRHCWCPCSHDKIPCFLEVYTCRNPHRSGWWWLVLVVVTKTVASCSLILTYLLSITHIWVYSKHWATHVRLKVNVMSHKTWRFAPMYSTQQRHSIFSTVPNVCPEQWVSTRSIMAWGGKYKIWELNSKGPSFYEKLTILLSTTKLYMALP
jgi:hypothetical protein